MSKTKKAKSKRGCLVKIRKPYFRTNPYWGTYLWQLELWCDKKIKETNIINKENTYSRR